MIIGSAAGVAATGTKKINLIFKKNRDAGPLGAFRRSAFYTVNPHSKIGFV